MPPPLAISSGLGIGFGVLYFILLVRFSVYRDRQEALEAAGLGE